MLRAFAEHIEEIGREVGVSVGKVCHGIGEPDAFVGSRAAALQS
jgi:hypothetical protein